MNKFVGSLALIPDQMVAPDRWLVQIDDTENSMSLIAAERLEGESYRESLDREMSWLLDLERGKHYIISSAPRLHLNFPTELPGESEPLFYVVEFYMVTLFGSVGKAAIESRDDLIWIPTSELKAGVTAEGRTLHEGHRRLLCHGDVLPHPGQS